MTMSKHVKSNVRELWGNRVLKRPEPTDDAYFAWFKQHREELAATEGLVTVGNPFGAPTRPFLEIGEFKLEQCLETGYIYANPRLSVAAAKAFFDNFLATYFEEVEVTFERRRELSYLPVAKLLSQSFPKGGKLLEVGCGSGALMHVLQSEFGFDVEGVEISAAARPYHKRRNQKVFECAVEEMPGENVYDGVFMWSVADHFTDPAAAFSACQRLVRPGGAFMIANVNIDGFDIATIGTDSLVFAPPGRVNFYNLTALRRQLEMVGFTVEDQHTLGKLDVSIVRDYWADGGENSRNSWLTNLVLDPNLDSEREAFQEFLVANNLSGFQVVLARKGA